MHPLRFTALECFGLCGLFLFLGLFAGYAWAMRHLERTVMELLKELAWVRKSKADWLNSLRRDQP